MRTVNLLILFCLYFSSSVDCKSFQKVNRKGSLFQRRNCEVTEIETGLKKPCEGIFTYQGKTYYGCTTWESERCKFKVIQGDYDFDTKHGF